MKNLIKTGIYALLSLFVLFSYACEIKDPGLRQLLGMPKLESQKSKLKSGEVKEFYESGKLKSISHYKDTVLDGLKRNFRENGILYSEVMYKDGMKNGIGKNYYSDGKIQAEISYLNNVKNGDSKWYHQNGNLYRLNPYKDGKLHGVQKKYYESGKLQSEIPYFEGEPGVGGKEYNESGKDITNRYKLILKEQNHVYFNNKYMIFLNVEPKHYGVDYYMSTKPGSQYIDKEMFSVANYSGEGVLTEYVFKGQNIMKSVEFFAVVKTKFHNELVLKKRYNIAVEHK